MGETLPFPAQWRSLLACVLAPISGGAGFCLVFRPFSGVSCRFIAFGVCDPALDARFYPPFLVHMRTGALARLRNRLTAAFVSSVTDVGKYPDGNGLMLRVYPTGAKCWEQRIMFRGRRRTYGHGGYPVVTLRMAREAALEYLRLVRQGDDPVAAKSHAAEPTFEEAALVFIQEQARRWTSPTEAAVWVSGFRLHVFPVIGRLLVSQVSQRDVLRVLAPLWKSKFSTAKRIRYRIGAVMKWAVGHGYRADNPAGEVIDGAVPRSAKNEVVHHPALPYAEVGAFVALLRRGASRPGVRLVMEFIVLTAVRSWEARGARWDEVDWANRVWSVPEGRMKARKAHAVPLSASALRVLEAAREAAPSSDLIFVSQRGTLIRREYLSDFLTSCGVPAVPHGFRSTFRDWCAETGVSREVAEICLAHAMGPAYEAAYRRTDMLERRREVMDAWAEYIEKAAQRAESNGDLAPWACRIGVG